MDARDKYRALPPFDPEGAVAVARAFLEETGDLPESVWHALGKIQHDAPAMWGRLTKLRAEHFRARGQEPPPYTRQWL